MASEKWRVRVSATLATAAGAADSARSRRVRIAALRSQGRLGRTLITDAGEEQDLRGVAALRAFLAWSHCRSKQDQLAHGPNPDAALARAGALRGAEG